MILIIFIFEVIFAKNDDFKFQGIPDDRLQQISFLTRAL